MLNVVVFRENSSKQALGEISQRVALLSIKQVYSEIRHLWELRSNSHTDHTLHILKPLIFFAQ